MLAPVDVLSAASLFKVIDIEKHTETGKKLRSETLLHEPHLVLAVYPRVRKEEVEHLTFAKRMRDPFGAA